MTEPQDAPRIPTVRQHLEDLDRRPRLELPATVGWDHLHSKSWVSGKTAEQPWLRAELIADRLVTCPFCGEDQLTQSDGDRAADPRRIEAYCNNLDCDAREIAIVALNDGTGPTDRPDITALQRWK